MSLHRYFQIAAALPLIATGACQSATDATQNAGTRVPVALRATAVSAAHSSASVSQGLGLVSLRLLVSQASLGHGDTFGCQNCTNNDSGNEAAVLNSWVTIPVNGGPVDLASEMVQPGSYDQVEIEVGGAEGSAASGTARTVEVSGTFNGVPFTVGAHVVGTFRETLTPPAIVAAANPPSSLRFTLALPVESWFSVNGVVLDPTDAAQRAIIEGNISRSFSPPESSKKDGR